MLSRPPCELATVSCCREPRSPDRGSHDVFSGNRRRISCAAARAGPSWDRREMSCPARRLRDARPMRRWHHPLPLRRRALPATPPAWRLRASCRPVRRFWPAGSGGPAGRAAVRPGRRRRRGWRGWRGPGRGDDRVKLGPDQFLVLTQQVEERVSRHGVRIWHHDHRRFRAAGAPGQALMAFWPPSTATCTLRGFACSTTGIRNISTPLS